jgi:hypothetical protein
MSKSDERIASWLSLSVLHNSNQVNFTKKVEFFSQTIFSCSVRKSSNKNSFEAITLFGYFLILERIN